MRVKVGFWYTEYGSAIVEADSLEEAEERVYSILEDDGLDGLDNYRCNDRDYGTADSIDMEKE